MLPYNLGRFGNGIAIWLGIQPYGELFRDLGDERFLSDVQSIRKTEHKALPVLAELFFYIFLPPLLLDAGVRIDFYIFKKVTSQVFTGT